MHALSDREQQTLIRDSRNGTAIERLIINILNRYTDGIYVPSSRDDNVLRDIDIVRVDECRTFSLKSGTKPERSGYFAFETAVLMNGKWKTSWYHTGCATDYLFVYYNTLYAIPKTRVKDYVRTNGFERICRTRAETIALVNKNHPHKGAQLGLLNLATLCTIGMSPIVTLSMDDSDYQQLCKMRYGNATLKTGKPQPTRNVSKATCQSDGICVAC